MNFPAHQRTGLLAEQAVSTLFTSWFYTVGEDRVDIGYDICVTPPVEVYRGLRFLIQVKGTAKKTGATVSAAVSRKRLRQYASDILPVFIVRVTPDGAMYWLHAQAWATQHMDDLKGVGKKQLSFDIDRLLSDRSGFEGYLDGILRPLMGRVDALALRNEEAPFDLHRASQSPVGTSTATDHAGAAPVDRSNTGVGEVLKAKFSFKPLPGEENAARLREAFGYGLPRNVSVENFTVEPEESALSSIDSVSNATGELTLTRKPALTKNVGLCSGEGYTVLSQEFCTTVDVFLGQIGVGVTNEMYPSPINLKVTIPLNTEERKLDFTLGLRFDSLKGRPIGLCRELAPLAAWADRVAVDGAVTIFDVDDGSSLFGSLKPLAEMLPTLRVIRTMSRLHMIARSLRSDFDFQAGEGLSQQDCEDIDLAFGLLRGERKYVNLKPLEVSASAEDVSDIDGLLLLRTNWDLTICGERIGSIPIEIALPDYRLERIQGAGKFCIVKGVLPAELRYQKHGDTDMHITRSGL